MPQKIAYTPLINNGPSLTSLLRHRCRHSNHISTYISKFACCAVVGCKYRISVSSVRRLLLVFLLLSKRLVLKTRFKLVCLVPCR